MLRVNNGCWINVEERLPNEEQIVFVTDGKSVDVGLFEKGLLWVLLCNCCTNSIQAWMPWPSDPNDFYVYTGRDS